MAVGCHPPPLSLFTSGASSLPIVPNPVASCFYAIFIGVLFFCCFCLFATLCGCCSWRIHSNSPILDCFMCPANLLRIRFAAHHLLLDLFSCPYRNKLPTPPFASIFRLNTIGSLSAAVICIVCVCVFFPCIVGLLSYIYVFSLLLLVFSFFPFIFLYVFIYVSAYNKALSSLFDLPGSTLIQTLGCGCERFPGFQVEENEFRHANFTLKAEE
jgi:uncharacterized membrane protein